MVANMLDASLDACSCPFSDTKQRKARPTLDRTVSFIRAHDLELTDEDIAKCSDESTAASEESAMAARTDLVCCTMPIGGSGKKEVLVSLGGNDGSGAIMKALVTIGLREATDESNRWSAYGSTDKILRKDKPKGTIMGPWTNSASGNDILVWSSKCTRPGHGSSYPVVKSRGLIPASACAVVELIKDSDRVMEYNKMSIGREDQVVLTQDVSSSVHCLESNCPQLGVPGEAKIMSSKCQPPLTLKPLEFKTLFYARQLNSEDGVEMDGVAYITVGRSVWETPEGTTEGSDGTTTRCEIMLSVNLVREITTTEGGTSWCELTSITHAISPGVPVFIGKKLGLVAAENYIKDIRSLFVK